LGYFLEVKTPSWRVARKEWILIDYFNAIFGAACFVASTVAYHPISGIDKSYPLWFPRAFELSLLSVGVVSSLFGIIPTIRRRDLGPLLIGMLAFLFSVVLKWLAMKSTEAYATLLGESILAAIIAVAAAPRIFPKQSKE